MLVRFESQILSELFLWWAVKEELQIDKKTLDTIRTAIVAKHPTSGRQNIPHHLIHDEYNLALEALRQLRLARSNGDVKSKDDVINFKVRYKINKSLTIEKPFPALRGSESLNVPDRFVDWHELLENRKSESRLARRLVANRFDMAPSSVYHKLKMETGLEEPTKHGWKVLGTCFLELTEDKNWELRAKILDSLYLSKYHLLKMYWLIYAADKFCHPLTLSQWNSNTVRALCNHMNPSKKPGPFTELLNKVKRYK